MSTPTLEPETILDFEGLQAYLEVVTEHLYRAERSGEDPVRIRNAQEDVSTLSDALYAFDAIAFTDAGLTVGGGNHGN